MWTESSKKKWLGTPQPQSLDLSLTLSNFNHKTVTKDRLSDKYVAFILERAIT
jgi:hypothetical protein